MRVQHKHEPDVGGHGSRGGVVRQSIRDCLGDFLVLGVAAQVRALADVGSEVEETPECGSKKFSNQSPSRK